MAESRGDAIRQRVELLGYLSRLGWGWTALLGGSMVIRSALPAVEALALGWLVAGAAQLGDGAHAGVVAWPLATMALLLVYGRVSAALIWPAEQWAVLRVNADIRARIRAALVAPAGVAHLEDQEVRKFATMPVDVGYGSSIGSGVLGQLFVVCGFVGGLGSVAILVAWNPLIGLFALGAALWNRSILQRVLARATISGLEVVLPRLLEASYWTSVASAVGAKEIRLFDFVAITLDRIRGGHAAFAAFMADLMKALLRKSAVLMLLPALGVTVPIAWAVRDGLAGSLDLPGVATVLGAAVGAQALSSGGMAMFAIELALRQLGALRELESAAPKAMAESQAPPAALQEPPTIKFERVTFRYPGATRNVFEGLDLEIRPGESLAVVGENGVGKTTLVKLLAGFYEPDSGRITANGVDIRQVDPVDWRANLAVIFQSFVKFHLTAGDNVAMAGLTRPDRQKLLDAAAAGAGATDIVRSLPAGWDTMLSRDYRGGADLSGGQWQRIALARVLYAARAGARVLVLDEPTAQLDVHAELAVFNELLAEARAATKIVLSHRYSTVRQADRIVVLGDGRVIEDGSHSSLMELGGVYARLYTLQAQAFLDTSTSRLESGDGR